MSVTGLILNTSVLGRGIIRGNTAIEFEAKLVIAIHRVFFCLFRTRLHKSSNYPAVAIAVAIVGIGIGEISVFDFELFPRFRRFRRRRRAGYSIILLYQMSPRIPRLRSPRSIQ